MSITSVHMYDTCTVCMCIILVTEQPNDRPYIACIHVGTGAFISCDKIPRTPVSKQIEGKYYTQDLVYVHV